MAGSPFFDGVFLAIPKWARTRIVQAQKPAALQVLCTLVDHMNMRTKRVTLSITDIANDCLLSKETIKRTIKWLVAEGIIDSVRTGGKTSEYLVKYTPTGVTHDTSVVSPMTPVASDEDLTGVTHDTSLGPENSGLAGEMLLHNRIVLGSSIDTNREVVCDDLKGPSMILGEDPEKGAKTSPVAATGKRFKEVEVLVNRFVYSKPLCMKNFSPRDITILRRACKLMLQSGLSPDTIQEMIDVFVHDTRFQDYDNVINAFASKKIQALLLDRVTVSVNDEDPVIMLMVNDFVRPAGITLPWPVENDVQLRKIILVRCLEGLYRYPDVVASIITHWSGDFQNKEFITALSALESLIKSGLGKETPDIPQLSDTLSFMHLPKSLLAGTPRESAGNLAEAAYATRRVNRV